MAYTPAGGSARVWQTRGDVRVAWREETFAISTDLNGKIDERISQRMADITFVPVGEWGNLDVLWPLSNNGSFVGTEVFPTGGTENVMLITGRDLVTLQFNAVGLTGMPDVIQSTTKTLIGQAKFTAIGVDNQLWSVANSMWTTGTVGSWVAPTFTSIPTETHTVAWGSASPFSAIETLDGVHTSFDMQLTPVPTDNYGVIGYTYAGLAVSSKFQPVNVSLAQFLAKKDGAVGVTHSGIMQGPGATRGASISCGDDLIVTGLTASVLTVKRASLKNPGAQWGTSTPRIPTIELIATLQNPGDPWFTLT